MICGFVQPISVVACVAFASGGKVKSATRSTGVCPAQEAKPEAQGHSSPSRVRTPFRGA